MASRAHETSNSRCRRADSRVGEQLIHARISRAGFKESALKLSPGDFNLGLQRLTAGGTFASIEIEKRMESGLAEAIGLYDVGQKPNSRVSLF